MGDIPPDFAGPEQAGTDVPRGRMALPQSGTVPPAHTDDRNAGLLRNAIASPPILVAVDALTGDIPLRSSGVSEDHILALVEAMDSLPGILVQRATLQVIDGRHRVAAAVRAGHGYIRAHLIDVDDADALAIAIMANASHGLPLTRDERRSAVARLLEAHPAWSDRRIAAVAGVSHRTVAVGRARSGGQSVQLDSRIGRDGKARPPDSVDRRARVLELVQSQPEASIRAIAQAAEVSPSTVFRWRKATVDGAGQPKRAGESLPSTVREGSGTISVDRPADGIRSLLSDPSLRGTENGRLLLRVLTAQAPLVGGIALAASVPPHRRETIARVARFCAESWVQLAENLEGMS